MSKGGKKPKGKKPKGKKAGGKQAGGTPTFTVVDDLTCAVSDGSVIKYDSCNEHGPCGAAKRTYPNGTIEEFTIVDGQRSGPSKVIRTDGTTGDFDAILELREAMNASVSKASPKEGWTVHEIVQQCVLWLKSSELNTLQCEHPDQLYPEYQSFVACLQQGLV